MATIPLPALHVNTDQQSPLALYAQAQQIRNAQQQQQLTTTEVQQRQIQLQDQQATTAAMKEWDGKNPDDLPPLVLKNGGSSTAVFGLKNQILDWKTKAANLNKDQLDNLNKTNDIIAGHFEAVKSAKPEDKAGVYTDSMQDLQDKGLVKPGQFPAQYPGDDVVDMWEKQHMGQKAIVEQAQKDQEIKQKQEDINLRRQEFQSTMPGGAKEAVPQRELNSWLAANPGKTAADYEVAMKKVVPLLNLNLAANTGVGKPAADVAKQFGMTPEAFDQAAEKYYQTGTMPQMGRGAQGMALQRAIMNRTGELHGGASLAKGSAEYAANKESLKKLQGNFDAVSAFENTALKNIQLFRDQAKKVIDTGIPLLNAPIRGAAKLLGSKDQAGFETALQVANNEIAKVTSSPGLSGVLSDSARKEVEAYNPKSATVGQAMHVADILTQDMANRHQSYQDQIADIQKRIGGGGTQQHVPGGEAQGLKEGTTGTGTDGKEYVVKGGKWQAQ